MITLRMDQRSDDWYEARRGRPSASSASKVITSTGKASASMTGYLYDLLAARASYEAKQFDPTPDMQHGIDTEDEAIALYGFLTDVEVEQVGLLVCEETGAVASPDGLVSDGYGLEVKCPKASTFFKEKDGDKVPAKYLPQIHWSLAVSGYDRWDYMAYLIGQDPIIKTVERNEYTEEVHRHMTDFCDKLDALTHKHKIDWS